MKRLTLPILSIVSALLPFTAQANFKEASAHLDLDGTLIGYMDFEGDGQEIGAALNDIYQEVITNTPEMPPIPIDFTQLFTNLGFGSMRSIGFSSKELEGGLHRNRSVMLLDGEPAGLFALYGTELHTFTAAEMAPADANGAITAAIDLTVLRDTTIAILQQVMGPMGEGMAQQQLALPITGTEVTYNEAIEALSGKWDGFWHESYTEGFESEFKFWMSIENAGGLLAKLRPLADGLGVAVTEDSEAVKVDLSDLLGSEAPFGLFIESPKGSEALIIYSDADWSPTSEGPRLTENPEFAALYKRLPSEGLAFSYSVGADLSPLFSVLEMLPDGAKYEGALQAAIDLLIGDYLKPNLMVSTLKDGAFISEQYAGYSTKQVVMALPAIVGTGVGAAMAVPAYSQVRSSSKEKAVTNNLRQIYHAGAQYMLENGVNEARYDQLIGPDAYINELQSVSGESYEDIVITSETEELSVTLEDGTVISYTF